MSNKEHKSRSHSDDHVKPTCEEKLLEAIKHYHTFYDSAPPGLVKEDSERPEDCIPDLPENRAAREFLAKAPTKGLWMPLGKEVKVMKCWRCKNYGHRTGDKECPMFLSGNKEIEQFRYIHEDPMYNYIQESRANNKEEKLKQLKALLVETSSSSDSSDSNSESDSDSSSSSDHTTSSSSSTSNDETNANKKRKRKATNRHHKSVKQLPINEPDITQSVPTQSKRRRNMKWNDDKKKLVYTKGKGCRQRRKDSRVNLQWH